MSSPFLLLAAAAFLSAIGARIMDPLLAVLASEFHASLAAVSVVIAAFTLPYGVVQLLVGPLADRFGKLRVMAGTMLAYAVTMSACALAATLPQLAMLRGLTGASAAGLVPLSLAYIGDTLPYEERQIAMSRITAGFTLGQIMAGPIGGVFGDDLGWRGVFLAVGGIGVAAFALLSLRLRGLPEARARQFDFQRYRTLATDPEARTLLLTTIVEGTLFAGSFPFVAPFLRDGWGLSYTRVGLILACFGLGGLFYALVARRMVPALGERGLVLLGGALLATAMTGVAMASEWSIFPVFEAMLGFGYFTAHGVLQARATELLPRARSTATGLFALMLFIGQSLGALGLGALVVAIGFRPALLGVCVGITALTLWLAWLVRAPARQAHKPGKA